MDPDLPRPILEDLADTLWQERHLVESLLMRMVTAKLLLAADEHRFVSAAVDEIEEVVAALRGAEQRRDAAVQAVADRLEVPAEDLTLAELARRAPTPMDRVFADHRSAFLTLTAEIEDTATTNRQLASSSLGRVQRSLDALAGGPDPARTYTAAGTQDARVYAPMRLDQSL